MDFSSYGAASSNKPQDTKRPRYEGTKGTGRGNSVSNDGGKGSYQSTDTGGKGDQFRREGNQRNERNESEGLSITDFINLQTQATLRLLTKSREETKKSQYIFEILPDNRDLTQAIQACQEKWQRNRPDRGPHPDGPLDNILWHVFANLIVDSSHDHIQQRTGKQLDDAQSCWKALKETLQRTYVKDQNHTNLIHKFAPLGRKTPPPSGNWLFALQFNNYKTQGRDAHEHISDNISCFTIVPGILLHHDRAPVDQLERRLRNSFIDDT